MPHDALADAPSPPSCGPSPENPCRPCTPVLADELVEVIDEPNLTPKELRPSSAKRCRWACPMPGCPGRWDATPDQRSCRGGDWQTLPGLSPARKIRTQPCDPLACAGRVLLGPAPPPTRAPRAALAARRAALPPPASRAVTGRFGAPPGGETGGRRQRPPTLWACSVLLGAGQPVGPSSRISNQTTFPPTSRLTPHRSAS
ncbi:zinc-ribbon domain-containing protein [Streptomyces sp. NPDC090499]|uniref:zinc-ribbon domain-containing protein n=1 Tax=Streptomyces sp. NPDC090499 TaxID=3365965 RepID=UPI00380F1AC6